ncbi:MAG: phosphotransferase [Spirochaetota bacterium]
MELSDLCELRTLVENLVSSARALQGVIDRNYRTQRLREVLDEHYDIGELAGVRVLERGYVNVSYEIQTSKGGKTRRYFLRQYKRGIREEEVRFEHSLVRHLARKGFTLSADLIPTKTGGTYVRHLEEQDGEQEEVYFAVFEYLPGEDRYTWDNPACTETELAEAARVLARYHRAVHDLEPRSTRYEAGIVNLLPTISGNLMKYAKRAGCTKFDAYYLKNLDHILQVIQAARDRIDPEEYRTLPQVAIHCDYHPGNLKFQDHRVVGVFDFDWSKIDARCFDVALAVVYACTTWEGKEDGDLVPARVSQFLGSYQQETAAGQGEPGPSGGTPNGVNRGPSAGPSGGAAGVPPGTASPAPGPLNQQETTALPNMLRAANLYVLNWDVDDYYIKKPNPYEYLLYLQHNVRTMRWIEENWDELDRLVRSALGSGMDLPGKSAGPGTRTGGGGPP